MAHKVKIGITQGDSHGVGLEVILKAIGAEGVAEVMTPVVFATKRLIDEGIRRFLPEGLAYHVVKDSRDIADGKVNLIEIEDTRQDSDEILYGVPTGLSGGEAVSSLRACVGALKDGVVDVMVTAPICKENVQSDSFNYPGHTEFLEAVAGEGHESLMILFSGALRVALVTGHIPLSRVPESLTKEKIENTVRLFDKSLQMDFGVVKPRIAVLSLNPHMGDGGLLGNEENEVIIPAIEALRQEDYLVFGPYPADGFFGHGDFKKFDGIVAMYHDQGLAPFKSLAGDEGVNFTAGLPFVRTSPAHGTAFGIAGKGEADETSMRQAIYEAIDIIRRRKTFLKASAHKLPRFTPHRADKDENRESQEKNSQPQ